MAYKHILYYGKPDLAAEVFKEYMTRSGFTVTLTRELGDLLNAAKKFPQPIVVLAVDIPVQSMRALIDKLHGRGSNNVSPIYVLPRASYSGPQFESVHIMPRPSTLSQVAVRILQLRRA